MDLVGLEVGQQVVDLLVFGHEIGLAHQLLPAELAAVVDVGQQVLDIKRSLDVVYVVLVDRDARKSRLDNGLLDRLVIVGYVEHRDVHAGLHDLLHLGIDEIDDSRQHHMLLRTRTLGHVHRVGQLVERNLALVRSLLADAAARPHQRIGDRIENPPQHREGPRGELREAHGNGLRQHLGQYLAEEQQQKGHQYGLEEEFEPQEGENRIYDARREDDDADIHQIVHHENCRQQQVHVRQQAEHRLGRRRRAFAQAAYIVVRQ